MPDIDTDLFQVIALGLLGITAVLLLAVLSALSGIRKILKQQLTHIERISEQPAASWAAPQPAPAADYGLPTRAEEPEPLATPETVQPAAQSEPEPEPAGAEPAAAAAATGGFQLGDEQAQPETAPEPSAAEGPSQMEERPAAAGVGAGATAEENPFMRDAGEPVPQSTLDEPQEQPFERGGRWYFRRGDELLVYDEGTGEWVPAPSAGAAGLAPSPAPSEATPSEAGGSSEPSPAASPSDTVEFERPASSGGFWKCPSCGAVNGASASTCRMCFSARP
jgi:Zn-finger in Ran binding protein and others